MIRLAAAVVMFMASVAMAAPDTSLRPVARAGTEARNVGGTVVVPRPDTTAVRLAAVAGPATVLRPNLRPPEVEQKAMARKRKRAKGAVCGDPDLQGSYVGAVPGRIAGCGLSDGIKLRSVSGVTLSQQSVMDCDTAKALKRWTERTAIPALSRKGGGLSGYRVAAHYACRTRNSQKGARISEHGKGRAIDISGFTLRDGTKITVLKGWNAPRTRSALRKMHAGACGPFGTVLGPEADRYHRDHFHFDTARYRSGSYCR